MRRLGVAPAASVVAVLLAAALVVAALTVAPAPAAADDDYEPTTLVYPPFRHCLGIHRATTFHLFVYLGRRTRFNEPAGLAAVKLRSKDDPTTESDDDELTVFGLNSGECEIIYNTSLYDVRIYGERGSGPGQFADPLGIAADEHGTVVVADTGNDRVVRLRYVDDGLEFVRAFGSTGSGERHLRGPSQIALGASGSVYVSDTGNDRIVVLSLTGEPIGSIAGDAEAGVALEGPTGLAVVEGDDAWIARKRDFIAVSDRGGRRLLKLSRDGRLEGAIESADLPVPDASFDYLAIDFYGNTYATDRANGKIHKFDSKLRHVISYGRPGTGDRELDEPRGITIWRRFGQVFVTERAGAQYFWIGTEILDLEAAPASFEAGAEEVTVSYYLTETARVTVELLDDRGRVVHTLVESRRRAIGPNRERWDGIPGRPPRRAPRDQTRDSTAGDRPPGPLPPGPYTLRVTAQPTYSSGKYFQDTAEIEIMLETPGGR
jgi:DNA-binding beta-propeller fold protein YncE